MGGRRKTYSQAEKDQFKAADKALREAATALLEDPERSEQMRRAFAAAGGKLADYSERNQALLYSQAEDRGMTLTEVGSFRKWAEHGRMVRKGERGLRIVAPKGRELKTVQEQPAPPKSDDKAADGEDEMVRFRMVAVFDISQTDELSEEDAVKASDRFAPEQRVAS